MNGETGTGKSLRALLADWAGAVSGTSHPQAPYYDGPDRWLTHLTEKTSEVTPGACFVARVRESSDGHPYIGAAIDEGAVVILAEKPADEIEARIPEDIVYLLVPDTAVASAWLAAAWEGFPSQQLVVIGITGTDGKTSTANILLSLLRAAGMRTGLLSTTRAVIGDEEEPLALHVTTPEAPIVQHHLRRMVDSGLTHCILEATSHGLAQHRVSAIEFDLAVVTNITHEHLDYHGDFNQYLAAKSRLFQFLTAGSWRVAEKSPLKREQVKTAVLNRDDDSFEKLSAIAPPRQLSYAIHAYADAVAADIQYASDQTQFTLRLDNQLSPPSPVELAISSPLTGKFNVYNTLAAAAAALAAGAPTDAIVMGLAAVEPIDGRMELIDSGQPYSIIVDFAHTPNALAQAIEAARSMTKGRVIAVFGSAGKRDISKRSQMAQIAAQNADLSILTAEDPRTDSLQEILQTMADASQQAGGIEGESFWRIPDRGQAIYFALSLAETGDLVLICGKGHEQSMCFGSVEYLWDDRVATQKAVEALTDGKPMPDLGLPTFSSS